MNASVGCETNATVAHASEWREERLDVDAYLWRMGYDGDLKPTVETLRGLHRAHVAAIPFENLDIVLGRGVSLEMDAMQEKLIGRDRGGAERERGWRRRSHCSSPRLRRPAGSRPSACRPPRSCPPAP